MRMTPRVGGADVVDRLVHGQVGQKGGDRDPQQPEPGAGPAGQDRAGGEEQGDQPGQGSQEAVVDLGREGALARAQPPQKDQGQGDGQPGAEPDQVAPAEPPARPKGPQQDHDPQESGADPDPVAGRDAVAGKEQGEQGREGREEVEQDQGLGQGQHPHRQPDQDKGPGPGQPRDEEHQPVAPQEAEAPKRGENEQRRQAEERAAQGDLPD